MSEPSWQSALRRWANAGAARLPPRLALASARALAWLRRFLLGPHVLALGVDSPQGTFLFSPEDDQVGATLRWGRTWAPQLLEALLEGAGPAAEVLVIGAHVGTLLVPLARRARRVVGLEPHPGTFRLLQMNLLLNGVDNAEVHAVAAGAMDGRAPFRIEWADPSHSRLLPTGDLDVPVRRLDGLFEGRVFDVVVLDVEGAEVQALEGMGRLLEAGPLLAVEIVPANHADPLVAMERVAALLEPHYDRCRFVPAVPAPEAPVGWRSRADFRSHLRDLVTRGFHGDVLFAR